MTSERSPNEWERGRRLRESIVAGLHFEGGWLVRGLSVTPSTAGRYIVSFVAEDRL